MSVSSFPLACQVVQLKQDELEVRFQQALHLRPGQLLRFEREDGNRLYGRIVSLKLDTFNTDDDELAQILATVEVLLGEADLTLNQAYVLAPDTLKQDFQILLGNPDYPIKLGEGISVDFKEYQTLALIRGSNLSDKLSVLAHWLEALNPYQHIIVIDPLGIMQEGVLPLAPEGFAHVLKGGVDASLSLQHVGIKHFLSVLATMLPDVIRNEAIQLLAEVLPIGQNFIPFRDLLRVETITERGGEGPSRQALAMKTPLLNCLYEIDRQRVFADSPREVLAIPNILRDNITVIDLSSLSEPWKSLFYEEICLDILANADRDIMPVLIYPENYLTDFKDYVKKLNEADISSLALASPYLTQDLQKLADSHIYWNALGDIYLEGSLTYGLPIPLQLPELPKGWKQEDEEEVDSVPNPLQARYSQKGPIASPSPSDLGYTVNLGEDLPTWYDETPHDVDMPAFPETGNGHVAGVEPADAVYAAPKISNGKMPVVEPEVEDDELPFDSILGSLTELSTTWDENDKERELSEAFHADAHQLEEHPPHVQASALKLFDTEELGGDVIRAEPEFISGSDLQAHAPNLANAMLQALETQATELTPGQPEGLSLGDSSVVETATASAYYTSDIPDYVPEATSHPEDFAPEATQQHDVPLESSSEGAHKAELESSEDDDFNFEFSWEEPTAQESPEQHLEPSAIYASSYQIPLDEPSAFSVEEKNDTILSEPPPILPRSTASNAVNEAMEEGAPDYQVGDRVMSDKYGAGVVQKIIPMDSVSAIHVLFDNGSKRTIVPSPTNLQKI